MRSAHKMLLYFSWTRPAKELRPGTAADWDGFTWTMWLT